MATFNCNVKCIVVILEFVLLNVKLIGIMVNKMTNKEVLPFLKMINPGLYPPLIVVRSQGFHGTFSSSVFLGGQTIEP